MSQVIFPMSQSSFLVGRSAIRGSSGDAKVALLPLSLGGKHNSQLTNHLRMVTELCYLESHTFIQQVACSSDGMQSKTHPQKMLMAKSFLQELLQLLSRRIPQCTHLVVMNNWAHKGIGQSGKKSCIIWCAGCMCSIMLKFWNK